MDNKYFELCGERASIAVENPNYAVTESGAIWSIRFKRFIKPFKRKGILHIKLPIDKVKQHFSIHRLVATNFVENPDSKPVVDHIDNNTLNNHYSNLRWATIPENNANRYTSKKDMAVIYSKKRDGYTVYLGFYKSEAEARQVFAAALTGMG